MSKCDLKVDDDVVEGRSSIGRKALELRSSSSSASWSSEEQPRRGNRRPFPGRRPQRPTEIKETCDDGWLEFKRPNGVWCILRSHSLHSTVHHGFIPGPGDSVNWKPAFVNGDFDKYQCNSQVHPWTRFYICGKRGVRK
ncbi:Protein CBG04896 [Caenorhabditis briggsae]|uniref:Protein CBG04896 n=1 Tax=Caenorhabditis briggsae TaxID=6238 RepID=A8WYR2_CAEBR|nr:Protein CBG04896 [Caenorhabditis briggsae]CAP25520.2 Protein CBG04896 [Caenorhabditis briggsae]